MLTIDRVCKSFGSLSVLKDVSLTVGDGEIVALIGPSGCGKTTLLDFSSGLSQPDSGTVIGGENISYMFQSARLLPWRTVYENIRLVREDVSPEEIHELIKAVGLEGFANYYPDQLSGGMAKRCALARAFHYQGTHLLMDEPFQGLDYGIRMEMIAMLLSVWKKHRQGILFVTHEIDEAACQTHDYSGCYFLARERGTRSFFAGVNSDSTGNYSCNYRKNTGNFLRKHGVLERLK